MPGGLQSIPGDLNVQGDLFVQGSMRFASSSQIKAPDGAFNAPGFSFASELTTGFYHPANGSLRATVSGNPAWRADSAGNLVIGGSLFFSTGDNTLQLIDCILLRDAADTLAQRRGVNPQVMNLYNTFTDAANFERLKLSWAANLLTISPEALGTGVLRSMLIGASAAQVIGFMGAAGQAQKVGFGVPTGGGVIANFPGATATLAQCSQAIAQLLLDLKALGFLGA